jgi:septum formation protein
LLRSAGVPFSVVPAAVAESDDDTLGLTTLVATNARAKALEVAARYPDAVVLGADTLVWLGDRALGKPADHNEARRMLRELSGQTHEVATGVHLVRMEPRQQVEFHEITRVRFRPLGEEVIEEYLATVDVLDKAGAYALQENGEMLVESVEGSRSNVVGLPLERTVATLAQNFGW